MNWAKSQDLKVDWVIDRRTRDTLSLTDGERIEFFDRSSDISILIFVTDAKAWTYADRRIVLLTIEGFQTDWDEF